MNSLEKNIIVGQYHESNPEDYSEGGYVKISCSCGFEGFADAEDSGEKIYGECEECYTPFSQMYR